MEGEKPIDKRIGNKFAEGLTNSGRPPIYDPKGDGIELMYDRILKYFEYIQGESTEEEKTIEIDGVEKTVKQEKWIREPEPMTITGLALFLGFSTKTTLYEYAKRKEFANSIKRALTFVEKNYEEMLLSKASTGAIFALKNMGWQDRQETTTINYNAEVTKQEAKNISDALEDEV